MKFINKPTFLVIAAALGMVLTGCGKSKNNGAANNPIYNGGLGTIPGYPGGLPGTPGGCYPITQGAIPFVMQNAHIDSANIIANQSQMAIGGNGQAAGGSMFISNQWRGIQGGSLISMSVAPVGNSTYQGSGVVQLSQAVIQQIMVSVSGYGNGYNNGYNNGYGNNNGYGSQPCVTSISLNAGHNNEKLYNGRLYLGLSVNGQMVGTYTVNL